MVDFTGTAEEKAFKSKIHQILLLNELGGVEASAYQLGIGNGKSGYSFGFAQWDLHSNPIESWGILYDILQNATILNDFSFEYEYVIEDSNPNTKRGDDEIILSLKDKARYRVTDPRSFSSTDIVHINTALSSQYGKDKIDAIHDTYLGNVIIPWVNSVIASVTDAQDRAFLQRDLGSLFLADVRNQFAPTPVNNGLAQFVQGNTVNLGTGQIKKIGALGVDDLLNFYFSTLYARQSTGLNDLVRRFRNTATVAGGYTLPADAQAKEEETKGLIRVYQDYLKGKEQLSNFSAFNTAILQPAKNYLVNTYVTAKNLGITIDGNVQVGEDQTSFTRSSKKTTADDPNLVGTAQNDLIFGESGNDTLKGEGGQDVLYGGEGNDILMGGPGDDVLDGGPGNDTYIWRSGDGNDCIIEQADPALPAGSQKPGWVVYKNASGEQIALVGGSKDNSSTIYQSADQRFTYELNGTTLRVSIQGEAGSITIENFQNNDYGIRLQVRQQMGLLDRIRLTGDEQANFLVGTAEAEEIQAFEGDDWAEGKGGSDRIEGNAGKDTISGGAGNDILDGGAGDDALTGSEGSEFVGYTAEGFPILEAHVVSAEEDDEIDGGLGNDTIWGEGGDDMLHGGPGTDLVVGGEGDDVVYGDEGDDTLWGVEGHDQLYGGPGQDQLWGDDIYSQKLINGQSFFAGEDLLDGGEDNDALHGMFGNDVLLGGDGDDQLEGDYIPDAPSSTRPGTDFLDGSTGNDTLLGDGGDDTLFGDSGDDVLWGDTSGKITDQDGNDYLDGGDGNDQLRGEGGTDVLLGDDGNDELHGGTGDDTLSGGAGQDMLWGDTAGLATGPDGNDSLDGGDGDDQLVGEGGDDALFGGTGNDKLFGLAGQDNLNGGDDQDELYGGDDNDVLSGDAGNDMLQGNDGDDNLAGGDGTDQLVGGPGNDTMSGDAGDDFLQGDDGDDQLMGGDGTDQFFGGLGNDTLDGEAGDDLLWGDEGDDQLAGGDGTDQLVGGAGNDTLVGDTGDDLLWGDDGDDQLTGGDGTDQLIGGLGNDTLVGDTGNDVLQGNDGDDILEGGEGNDQLVGGAGRDTFIGGPGTETIVAEAQDQIVLALGDGEDFIKHQMGGRLPAFSFVDGIRPEELRISTGTVGTDPAQYIVLTYRTDSTAPDCVVIQDGGLDLGQIYTFGDVTLTQRELMQYATVSLSLSGNGSSDSIYGGTQGDFLYGYAGDDSLYGERGDDVLYADVGNDTLDGGPGNDWLFGDKGNDTYHFGRSSGVDVLSDGDATPGNTDAVLLDPDILPSVVALDRQGDDLILTLDQSPTQLTVRDYFFDTLIVNGAPVPDYYKIERIVFGDGTVWDQAATAPHIISGPVNTMTGSRKDDLFVVDNTLDTVVEGANQGIDTIQSHVTYTLPANVEKLTLTGYLNVDATGNSLVNVLTGNSGNNVLNGVTGADTLIGGAGDDRYIINTDQGDPIIIEAPGEGIDWVEYPSGPSYALPANVENITAWSNNYAFRIVLWGNSLDNTLIGSRYGATYLDGGPGADTLIGGSSDDTYIVDNSGDTIVENITGAGWDTVQSSVSYTLVPGVENLQLTGSDPISGTGNAQDNQLDGSTNSAANVLRGGPGNDTYLLGPGDTVVEDTAAGTDRVIIAAGPAHTYTLDPFGNVENLALNDALDASNLIGNDAANLLQGNASANVLSAGAGNDSLNGYAQDDTLLGGAGDDGLYGGVGSDTYEGGAGNDQFYDYVDTSYNYNDADTYRFGRGDGQDTIEDVDRWHTGMDSIEFTTDIVPSDVTLVQNGNDFIIRINSTSDQVTVRNYFVSADYRIEQLRFADGTIWNATAINAWLATNGVNTPTEGADVLIGGTADDTLNALGGDDTVSGGVGNDILAGGSGNDCLFGNAGSDVLDGGAGLDTLQGGPGDDLYAIDNTGDVVLESANAGIDTISSSVSYFLNSLPNIENLTLTGTTATDAGGNALDNVLTGNSANNTFWASLGADTLIGGAGDDTYYVDNPGDSIIENANAGIDNVQSTVTYTLSANVEQLTLLDAAPINGTGNALANTITGNSANNIILGGAGNDTLTGGAGDDTLDGGTGADALSGGIGNDIYVIDNAGDSVTEDTSAGTDTVQSALTYTLGSNLERLTLLGTDPINGTGNTLANVLTGNSANNILSGGSGNDTLSGNAGNDILDGGTGNDVLSGGSGDDTYVVDSTGDSVTENANEGIDTVQSSVTYTLGAEVERLTLTGSSGISGTGNALDNILMGNSANNTLTGNAGNDTLNGGAGADTLRGGTGNDIYVVDTAKDSVTENANEGIDTVQSAITYTLGANVENLTLTGTTAINGTGNTLNNVLTGNSAANILTGNAGNDTLDGGAGNDTLVGGTGNDVYRFGPGGGQDTLSENDATAGNSDLVDVSSDRLHLVFSYSGTNLLMKLHGTSDSLTVQSWQNGTANQTEIFRVQDGSTLLNTQVNQLIQAMATFSAAHGGISWDQAIQDRPDEVQTVLAAYWHPPA